MTFTTDISMKLNQKIQRGGLAVCAVLLVGICGFISHNDQLFVDAFVVVQQQPTAVLAATLTGSRMMVTGASADADQDDVNTVPQKELSVITRRQLFANTASVALMSALAVTQNPTPAAAAAASSIGTSPDSPIVVLGGGGKVGKLCTQILASKGLYVRCTTRSGRQVLDGESQYVSYAPCDVTSDTSLAETLKGSSGCIFAASSSGKKKGGDPIDVDYVGCYKTAEACLAAKVPKLVVVSAGTVTRPDSAGFKATNFFVKYVYGDHIMDAKIAGENIVRDLYAAKGGPGLAYSVIRPGGLNDKPSVGSSKVHVSQGDVYSSEISREDVALVTVATLLKGTDTDFTTFELNQVEGLGKAMKSLPDLPAELVHTGANSFDGLVDGLLSDRTIKEKYPDLINSDFRGEGIPPIDTILSQYK
mmetsp:Transcript_6181/g.15515  ORF Transcript_6181/g.15515 Transcript_6181/m.15515 type:complete len:419 (-) Transcript_6181:2301-3557(-)